jgi:hypothetical protein
MLLLLLAAVALAACCCCLLVLLAAAAATACCLMLLLLLLLFVAADACCSCCCCCCCSSLLLLAVAACFCCLLLPLRLSPIVHTNFHFSGKMSDCLNILSPKTLATAVVEKLHQGFSMYPGLLNSACVANLLQEAQGIADQEWSDIFNKNRKRSVAAAGPNYLTAASFLDPQGPPSLKFRGLNSKNSWSSSSLFHARQSIGPHMLSETFFLTQKKKYLTAASFLDPQGPPSLKFRGLNSKNS